MDDLVRYHEEAGLEVVSARYLQFLDPAVVNYTGRLSPRANGLLIKMISAINLPILAIQRLTNIFPQSASWCSTMAVVAQSPA
jgi:hypothetical protein